MARRPSRRDAERNKPIRYRRPTNLLFAAISILIVACGDGESERVAAITSENGGAQAPERSTSSAPNTATLSWDAVNNPNLRGYRIYYGLESGTYLQLPGEGIDTGNVTSHVIKDLASGKRYYFVVTAFDTSNNESEFSNEVFKDIP